jgi:glutamine amidotransferase-like uncharacterized protein
MQKFERKLWIPICAMILTLTMTLTMISPLLIHEVKAQGAQVAIYNGSGAWNDSYIAFAYFCTYKGLSWKYVSASDINTGKVTYPTYSVFYLPGGSDADYNRAFNSAGSANIRNFVSAGGGYIGICAGAYYACSAFIWEGRSYSYTLFDLFNGSGVGSIHSIMAYPYAVMTNLTMNLASPINQYEPSRERVEYYGGPYFVPNAGVTVETLATYDQANNTRAAIDFTYGSGRVFLIGPHPEIDENSARDGNHWANIFYDYGSEWPWLWTGMDWLMKLTISQPPAEPALPPAGTQLFWEGFESGSFATNGWTITGPGKPWFINNTNPYAGTYCAEARNTGSGKWSNLTSRTISTAGYTTMVSVRYFRQVYHTATTNGWEVDWWDGTKWNIIELKHTWKSPNYADIWVFAGCGFDPVGESPYEFELTGSALNNPNFKLRFCSMAGATSDIALLDNIEVRGA